MFEAGYFITLVSIPLGLAILVGYALARAVKRRP